MSHCEKCNSISGYDHGSHWCADCGEQHIFITDDEQQREIDRLRTALASAVGALRDVLSFDLNESGDYGEESIEGDAVRSIPVSVESQLSPELKAKARAALSAIPSYADGLRPEVLAFAHAMEAKLRENDTRAGWKNCSPKWLLGRLRGETRELASAIDKQDRATAAEGEWERHGPDVCAEAADVANFAMMIADQCHGLAPVETPPDRYAVPSYSQGWDDAKRRAVEAVERLRGRNSGDGERMTHAEILAAIRAIEPGKGTHEERWAAAGFPFEWSDEIREYQLLTPDRKMMLDSCPTVQAVDAWIAAHGTDKTP
jgi:NTP pyrophosphatase (non-canonical NTP hydrolase)